MEFLVRDVYLVILTKFLPIFTSKLKTCQGQNPEYKILKRFSQRSREEVAENMIGTKIIFGIRLTGFRTLTQTEHRLKSGIKVVYPDLHVTKNQNCPRTCGTSQYEVALRARITKSRLSYESFCSISTFFRELRTQVYIYLRGNYIRW